jgi:hypothetical protein
MLDQFIRTPRRTARSDRVTLHDRGLLVNLKD